MHVCGCVCVDAQVGILLRFFLEVLFLWLVIHFERQNNGLRAPSVLQPLNTSLHECVSVCVCVSLLQSEAAAVHLLISPPLIPLPLLSPLMFSAPFIVLCVLVSFSPSFISLFPLLFLLLSLPSLNSPSLLSSLPSQQLSPFISLSSPEPFYLVFVLFQPSYLPSRLASFTLFLL